jgi:hypothetical protein
MNLDVLLHRALEAQAFRQAPLDELVGTGFHLPGATPQLDGALTQVRSDPNWTEVVRQLAELRLKGFWGVHLRLDKHDLELVPIYAWSGNLTIALVDQYMDFLFTVISQLKRHLGEFALEKGTADALELATNTAGYGAAVQGALSVVLELNKARMPNTNVLFVDVDGMSEDLAGRFSVNVQRQSLNPLTFNRPWVYAYGIDGVSLDVHGIGDIATLNKTQLRESMQFLRTQ